MKLSYLKSGVTSVTSRFIRNRDGSTLPFVALALPVILGMVGLGTDASLWMSQKISLQAAADSAVLAAGWEMAKESENYMNDAALREAVRNSYDSSANGELTLEIVEETDDGIVLSVSLSQDANVFFSRVIYSEPVRIAAQAQALVAGGNGEFCVLALEDEDSGALTTQGSVEISAPNCGLASNSTDDSALSMAGNVDVSVDNVRIAGDYNISGSVNFEYNSISSDTSALRDPYEDLEIPDFGGCDENNTSVNSSATLSPGVYCNGLDISGNNTIEFEPGLYIIDGGDFSVTGSGSLSGEGVTFILTGSGSDYAQLNISGSRSVSFTSPLEGEDWAGITFFQDRDAPQANNLQNKIVGTSDIALNGAVYFPSQGLWFGGDNSMTGGTDPCTRLIARTVTFSGNPAFGNNCDGYGVEDIGEPNVRLIQ